ncbi:hypothetical protein EVJ58_g10795 [Rhodofomes roseus]|uniref:Uncharacterized protein n=1 Tax=Rhodofomes roseus TaxID=34475 RepID=A0A4Y9XML0_9APHY|nr:hypothetical protein EVJ58_g10795 [Rhodofomes roseus]
MPDTPISAEEWARFEHYAPHVHVLRYTRDETIDSSFFLLLQQYARGQPLFPNLHELIWEHATPELVSVVSPSIRIIRLPEDEENEEYAAEAQVNVFHMRRHVFKALLPTVLKGVPGLEVLKTRTLGRETFWSPLRAPSGECLLSQSIRVLHISESFTTLTRVALVIISSLQRLVELSIKCSGRGPKHNLGMGAALDLSDVRPFNRLERLRIKGFGIEVTALIEAIVAPVLEDVGIGVYTEHHQNQTRAGLALGVALDTLRRRNADTLWRLHLDVRSWPVPFFPTTTEPTFAPIARPLLDLRHLRYVSIFNGGRADVSVPALVAAWPDLRTLIMPAQKPSPDMLTAIARTCTKLESLSFYSLAKEFLETPPVAAENPAASTDSDVAIPALRELRLIERLLTRDSPDAKHENITRFLRSLFPRLVVEQKLVGADPVPYTDMSLAWYYEDNL